MTLTLAVLKKEALFRGVFFVTLRQETECVGILYSGWKRLDLPVDSLSMVRMIKVSLGNQCESFAPYGCGTAKQSIVGKLSELS